MADAFGIVADQEQGIFYDPDGPRPVKIAISDHSDGIRTPDQVRQDNANLKTPFSAHSKAFAATKLASKEWKGGQLNDANKAFQLFNEFVGDKPTREPSVVSISVIACCPHFKHDSNVIGPRGDRSARPHPLLMAPRESE